MVSGAPNSDQYYLTDDDVYVLARIVAQHEGRVWNPNPAARYLPQPSMKEISAVALVLTPSSGIPAMWPAVGSGTGIGSRAQADISGVIGTGTGTHIYGGERPGFATCDTVYLAECTASGRTLNRPRILRNGNSIVVYNPSFEAVPGNIYLLVCRDGFGTWWPGGGEIIGSVSPFDIVENADACRITLSAQGQDYILPALVGTGTQCDPYLTLSGCTLSLHRGGITLSSVNLTNCVDSRLDDLCQSKDVLVNVTCVGTTLTKTFFTLDYIACPTGT